MGTESKSGQMVPAMREIGKTIELKVRESSPISMETSMRETGSTTRQTEGASTFM